MEEVSQLQVLENYKQISDVAFRAVNFIEKFLPDLEDPSKIVVLTNPQRDAIDSIQYGFPLRQFTFDEIKITPRGVVMVWPRQTGKTTACAYAAVAFLLIMMNCSIGIIAATEKQSRKLFGKIVKILKRSIFWDYVIKKTKRVDFLELENGNFVECWPCTDGIEGSTYTFLFVDEAAIMDEDIIFKSAMPTVTHGIRWIMLSTPKGPKGKFIDYYNKGLDTRPIICNSCGKEFPQISFNVDKFPIGRMPTDEMHECPFCGKKDYKYGIGDFTVPWVDPWNDGIRPKWLVKKLLDDAGWTPIARQEYLGEVISEASMVFLDEWIKNCVEPKLQLNIHRRENIMYVCGADYGRKHDASCFYVTHRNPRTGKIVLDFCISVAGEYDHQRTYKYIRKKLMKVLSIFDPVWVVPDATGMGDPLVEELEEDIKIVKYKNRPIKTRVLNYPEHTKGFVFSRKTKPELIGYLIKLFSQGKLQIPSLKDPEIRKLIEELQRFECDLTPGTEYIKYGTQSFHDDRVIALALSCWGHRVKPSMIGYVKIMPVTRSDY